jgi:uncharacterized protein YehS (DUF1456 family)
VFTSPLHRKDSDNEFEKMPKEAVVACLKFLSQNLRGRIDGHNKKSVGVKAEIHPNTRLKHYRLSQFAR